MKNLQRLNLKSWSNEDRPREKLMLKGKNSISDAELIAILIGSGTKNETAVELSKRILNCVSNNLNELGKQDLKWLTNFKGIGEAKAIAIIAALELGKRRKVASNLLKAKITSSQDAYACIEAELNDLPHEEFWILMLDRSNQLKSKKHISKGGVSGTLADAKLIFKPAVEQLASSIILCHNHPSGNLKASHADIQLTKKLMDAGKNLDICILDHIIVGNNAYISLADEGYM